MKKSTHKLSQQDFLKPRNSAGRNLKAAIGVGVGLGVLVILCILVLPVLWYPLVAAALGLATWEVCTRLRENGYVLPRTLLIIMGQAMIWASWPFGTKGLVAAYVTGVLALMYGRLFHHGPTTAPQNYLRDTTVGIFVLTWIPMFGTFAAMLSRIEVDAASPSQSEVIFDANSGSLYILTFMLCVVASDVGGYAAGILFGKHPMAPAVSPKKSWEGFAGSLVGGVIVGSLTVSVLLEHYWWMGAILGVLMVVCATLGDLVESQFKRELGIKDMSNILPGHGGIMDRLDGMLPAAMVTWLILTIINSSGAV
ncbi:phosphatidate cytidylyltransferase [Corynebacterium poyangense]|uniref:Phosphatidate cytidylyltransferase n=1 Tax=Corynebacterium poyangense TaxID=2684405 RepID=A0A7H0SPI5_9CORY|nr:phosphatidate cytidylyltransferase [Corynebacterium poyangense]QNQ90460.1 phosphatidate cytidylyltransferase [Corynebacterium poyangense]